MHTSKVDEPIQIADYDPTWPEAFGGEAAKLLVRLTGVALGIEHIGSSAVPGLRGKPILDIMVGVEARHLNESLLRPMLDEYESFGEAGVTGRLYFRKRRPNAVNIHAVLYHGQYWTDNLLLRDYLCAHQDVARRYAHVKDEIVDRGITTLLAYSQAKHIAMVDLLDHARAWGISKLSDSGNGA